MQVEAINVTGTSLQQLPRASEKIDTARKDIAKDLSGSDTNNASAESSVQPEELLNQIKALTENGSYAVRFEKNQELDELIVKVVDTETDEVIRQVPPEELLGVRANLEELRGKIVNTAR
jgi:flagellar protein FlaG